MLTIQSLAQAHTFQKYGLAKLARTRFLELADKGLLAAADAARLGLTPRFNAATGKLKNRMVQGVRGRLYGAATDLTPRQLAKTRTLGGKIEDAVTARHGVKMVESPFGPAASLAGNVVMDHDLRGAITSIVPLPKRDARAMGTIRRSVVDHELAEGAMGAGAANWARQQGEHEAAKALMPNTTSDLNHIRDQVRPMSEGLADGMNLLHPGTEHNYEAKAFASHHGPAALVAEAQAAFRDPAASRYMDKTRKLDPGDVYAQGKMKQFGHTPAYPMPMGGKQHFALDEAVAKMPEKYLTPGAARNRTMAPGSTIPAGAVGGIQAGLDQINEYERLGILDSAAAAQMRAQALPLMERAQKNQGVRTLPYADQQEARRRHMALFASVRNDANPGRRI